MIDKNDETALRPRAYSYLRFSTPEQMAGDSHRRQTDLAAKYAQLHGLELDNKLTFEDLGVSAFRGLNKNLGRLADFLEAVQAGQVPRGSYLLVESLDRISRESAVYAQHTFQGMIMQGITVVTLTDGREYSLEGLQKDPMGLMYAILGFMRANEESEVKSSRLKQAWSNKRALLADKPLTSIVPAWLELDRHAQQIAPIPHRAAIVQRIFAMTLEGVGQHAIAHALNAERVEPWGAGKRKAELWHRSYIAKILSNAAVVGTFVPHQMDHSEGRKRRIALEPVHGYFPAVIERDQWLAVQALLETKGGRRGRAAHAPLSNILAHMACCPKCGRTMTRVQKGARSVPSLVCAAAKVKAGCEYKSVRYETIERRLLQVLPIAICDREGIEEIEGLESSVANLSDAVDACRDDIERLADELMEGPSPVLSARLRAEEARLAAMQDQLATLLDQRDILAGPVVGSRIARAIKALEVEEEELDRQEANLALRGIFKRAVINWPEGTIDLEWHVGGKCRVHYAWMGGAWPQAQTAES